MLQFFMLSTLLMGSGAGVVLLFAAGMIAVALTGSTVLAGIMSAAISLFFLLLVIVGVLHVVRFFLIAGLSAALFIKRMVRRI